MMLTNLLSQRRAELIDAWFERIVCQYPQETAGFLRRQKDPFANPVGAGLRAELGPLLDGVLDGADKERLAAALDRILRVRAVQELAPSQAVAFVLELKKLVRAQAAVFGHEGSDQLAVLDDRIDRLLLLAFDVHSRCREQVYEIRVRAIHNRSLKVMERFNAWRARREERGDGCSPSPGS
jgi:hypothetical protein